MIARLLAAIALACAALAMPAAAQRAPAPAAAEVALAGLPGEARDTLDLIRKRGPYPYARDGVVFGNREGLLPKQPRGYYREYTVRTPGARDRGPKRIVAGSGGEYYYTHDHYGSFKIIIQ